MEGPGSPGYEREKPDNDDSDAEEVNSEEAGFFRPFLAGFSLRLWSLGFLGLAALAAAVSATPQPSILLP